MQYAHLISPALLYFAAGTKFIKRSGARMYSSSKSGHCVTIFRLTRCFFGSVFALRTLRANYRSKAFAHQFERLTEVRKCSFYIFIRFDKATLFFWCCTYCSLNFSAVHFILLWLCAGPIPARLHYNRYYSFSIHKFLCRLSNLTVNLTCSSYIGISICNDFASRYVLKLSCFPSCTSFSP